MEERPGAEAFCRRIRPGLIGALSLYCGDAEVAEEAVQETLARVWDRWDEVSRLDSPDGWAWRVNLANSWFRRRRAERSRERQVVRQRTEPQEIGVAEALIVRQAVSRLPGRQREALVLRYFQDLSVRVTADVMACAEGTVKALAHQARSALRDDPTIAGLFDAETPMRRFEVEADDVP